MNRFKNFCTTHHFNYSSVKCPFCEKDRIYNLTRRYYKEPIKTNEERVKEKEITINDLDKLKLKFQGHL